MAQAHRRPPHRRAQRLGGAQGRHPQGGRDPHRQGRHRRHRRVLRRGRQQHQLHRQGAPSATWAPRSAPPRRCSPTTTPWPATSRAPGGRPSPMPPTRSPTTCGPTTRSWPTRHDYFDQVIEIDLSTLTPHINGPHTPDLAREVKDLGAEAVANGWPLEISAALIGSCTNSRYEDITRAASIAREAAAKGLTGQDQADDHPRLRAGARHHRARRSARRLRGARRHRAGQRLRARASASGTAPTSANPAPRTSSSPATTATSPSATTATRQRWPSSPRPRPSWLSLWPAARLRSDQRHARQRCRRGRLAVDPGRHRTAAGGLRSRRGHLRGPARRRTAPSR